MLADFHIWNCAMIILLLTYNEGKRKSAAMLPCLSGNKNGIPPGQLLGKAAAWYLTMVYLTMVYPLLPVWHKVWY